MRAKGCLLGGLRFLGVLAAILILLGIGLAIYENRVEAAELEQFPAPGQMVDVGDHRLHLYCTGAGSPTVVLEAGGGSFSLDWSLVQPEVAQFTRVCSYDRAGLGWSEAGPQPRDVEQIAAELHTLLKNSDEPGPYVLVGHSFAGLVLRTFAGNYPEEVAGLVMVDAAQAEQWERLPAEYQAMFASERSTVQVMALLSRLGLIRLIGRASGADSIPAYIKLLPPELMSARLAFLVRAGHYQATYQEYLALDQSIAQAKALPWALGDRPLVVLTALHSINTAMFAGPAPFPPQVIDAVNQAHVALQAELAQQSTHGEQIVTDASDHAIIFYAPQLVVEAIRQVVSDVPR